ncbi:MAG: type IV toxin-antitoxin system AbiEi family antitoxin domain-containing protein, partial [Gammaproteobacteria bacterium]
NASDKHYLFTLQDLHALCPELSDSAFKTLLSRAAHSGLLVRVCRGLYLCKKALPLDGLLLFHAAALLRANEFNYISLETVLSDAGVISQIPMNWISIMSSGRSNIISCGAFGRIEFVHTNQKPAKLMDQLIYDHNCGLWRAHVALAIRDMKATRRNCDLIDWDIANELI